MDATTDLTQALAAEYDAALRRLHTANEDLAERVVTLGAMLYYDPEDDWFLISVGEPGEAVTLEVDDVWSFRLDPGTWKILGFEFPSVDAFTRTHPREAEGIRKLVGVASAEPATYVRVPAHKLGEVAAAVRELIPA